MSWFLSAEEKKMVGCVEGIGLHTFVVGHAELVNWSVKLGW